MRDEAWKRVEWEHYTHSKKKGGPIINNSGHYCPNRVQFSKALGTVEKLFNNWDNIVVTVTRVQSDDVTFGGLNPAGRSHRPSSSGTRMPRETAARHLPTGSPPFRAGYTLANPSRGSCYAWISAIQRRLAFMMRPLSRCQSRSFSVLRLSCCFLPFARPISSFARPSFQYSCSGTRV